jgi:2-hydroxychromene-2-carboxylate isomerase
VDREPWWEPAHLAWFAAERRGAGRAWVERVSRARWLEGRDICDPATVRELADDLGLDPDEMAGAVDDPQVRGQGVRALLDIQRDGVFGVPYFVHGSEPFWGLDRFAEFAASFPDTAPAPPGPSVPADEELAAVGAGRTTDMSHAGGCG